MSGSEKSVRPVRQLSLQPPAPHRQQIRRQRSAENDNSLQICASPFARGKRGTNVKPGTDRPKVRVAWKENRHKNEKELEQVEVVARQIPGRSRPSTAKSRAFIAVEKPTILYSRQELAERLRLAWKHREENKANINIFLARGILDERCESEMSNHMISASTSPGQDNDDSKGETPLVDDYKISQNEELQKSKITEKNEENCAGKKADDVIVGKSIEVSSLYDDRYILKNNSDELTADFQCVSAEIQQTVELTGNDVSGEVKKGRLEAADMKKEQLNEQSSKNINVDEYHSNGMKKVSQNIDCSNSRVLSTTLPSSKIESSTLGVAKVSKEDFSLAKQKRASFRSGTNRAFLDPIRSPSKCRWNAISDKTQNSPKNLIDNCKTIMEKNSSDRMYLENEETTATEKSMSDKSTSEGKCTTINEKSVEQRTIVNCKSTLTTEGNIRSRLIMENEGSVADNKTTTTQKTSETSKFNSSIKRTSSTSKMIHETNDSPINKGAISRNTPDVRCSSVNEKNPPSKKTIENQRTDQKSRRTNSAPPQRQLDSSASNNRVQVNIVIDSSSTTPGKNKNSEKTSTDYRDKTMERIDIDSIKVPSNRAVRSAPLKRRSRSAKRRFWSGNSGKNDEDGKTRNRSAGRAKNMSDSRTIDIVTMVSLVSSADSDSDTENSSRDDKLIDELRSKLPTTSIIKSSINSALSSARKPIKSVSFQKDSFDEDSLKEQQHSPKEEKKTTQPRFAIVNHRGSGAGLSSKETVSWRTDVVGLALPVLALIHDVEEPLDVPLTDREKRCLAVPIGDLHDKKRKLQKTRSTPSRSGMEKQIISQKIKMKEAPKMVPQKMEIQAQQTKTPVDNTPTNVKTAFTSPTKDSDQFVQSMSMEPRFKTNKEKECWHLYRKMCDKGVCVSFDTVLRGMLTPTEYRLRQKELSQNL